MIPTTEPVSLYERDFVLWIDDTVAKLRTNNFEDYPETQFPDYCPLPQSVDAIPPQKFWE